MAFLKRVVGAVSWLKRPRCYRSDGLGWRLGVGRFSGWPLASPEPLCFVVDACPDALASDPAS